MPVPNPSEELNAAQQLKRSLRKLEEANGAHRSLIKTLQSAGHNTKSILASIRDTRRDAEEVVKDLRDGLRHRMLLGIEGVDELLRITPDMTISETAVNQATMYEAEDAGYSAGKRAISIDENPYTPGSEEFAVWRKFWHDGQASNAAELAQTGAVASGAREHPGRKAAAGAARKQAALPAPEKKAAAKKSAPKKAAAATRKGAPRKAPAKQAAAEPPEEEDAFASLH